MKRRDWLLAAGGWAATAARANDAVPTPYAEVLRGRPLAFPRDFGAHPAFRTEWWYITGWLRAGEREFGVQVTFFRSRTPHDDRNPSRFAPKQLLLAHAAVAVDGESALRHDQRAARAGFGLAQASESDTDIAIGDWRLQRSRDDRYLTRIAARDFTLDLAFAPQRPPFAQGERGYSRKGPRPRQASHYYSRPQLAVTGSMTLRADAAARGATGGSASAARLPAALAVTGVAWLDHEWSSELLDPQAEGWDWVGLNLDDGSALMAFRIRSRDGGTLWSHAQWIGPRAQSGARSGDERPVFEPLRQWRSARSGATWPVAMRVSIGARTLELHPIFDDQELDTRASTGTIYWEGAVRVTEAGRAVGRGYLELTGYAGALKL